MKLKEKWISSHCTYLGLKMELKDLKLHKLRFSAATTFQINKAEGRAGNFSILIFYV